MLSKLKQKLISFTVIVVLVFGLSKVAKPNLAQAPQIGYLGPIGTYSEQATRVYQSKAPSFKQAVPYKTITDVTAAVKNGEVTHGLIPVENSDSGFVAETYRILLEKLDPGFRVIDEVTIPIISNLLVKPGTKALHIKNILSHPNALRGAAGYLKQNFPNIPLVEETSTAAAALKVSQGDGTTAAIASPNAGKAYGLQTLASNIQDKNSKTNFWIIVRSNHAYKVLDPNHLIIAIEAPSGSQILSSTVAELRNTGFNVVNVNSKPFGESIYNYRYLIRFESTRKVSNVFKRLNIILETTQQSDGQVLLIGAYRN